MGNVAIVEGNLNEHVPILTHFFHSQLIASPPGCQSVPLKKPESDGKNLKKCINLNQTAKNGLKLIITCKFGLTKNLNLSKNLKSGIPGPLRHIVSNFTQGCFLFALLRQK